MDRSHRSRCRASARLLPVGDRLVAGAGGHGRVQRFLYDSHRRRRTGSRDLPCPSCHGRGENAGLPPVWLVYITVGDLDESIARCQSLGGKMLRPPQRLGPKARFCVIQDPAGAAAALYETTGE
ncbi:MAG TPA: VOC family protein [Candidatus Solibacter sp.]|nr:VOC family protein [Candidatus Solibacter sp.]